MWTYYFCTILFDIVWLRLLCSFAVTRRRPALHDLLTWAPPCAMMVRGVVCLLCTKVPLIPRFGWSYFVYIVFQLFYT